METPVLETKAAANGTPEPAPEPKSLDTLSHKEFYKLCTTLSCEAERLMKERPTCKDTAKQMSDRCGFPITQNAIRNAMEATNINWTPRPPATVSVRIAKDMIERLRLAVLRLYEKLGETLPESLDWPSEDKE